MMAMPRRLWILGLALAGIVGCAEDTSPSATPEKTPVAQKPNIPIPKLVEPPPPRLSGKLELLVGDEGQTIRLGDTPDMVEKLFPVPTGSVPFKDLPPGFGEGYTVRGYETSRGSFGALFFDNSLILVLERRENVDPYVVGTAITQYERAYGRPTDKVINKRIQYYFWEFAKEDRRIMICSTPDERYPDTVDLNIAMGDVLAMSAFRMSVEAARNDQDALEKARQAKTSPQASGNASAKQ